MQKKLGGIKLRHNKFTENSETADFPLPKQLTVSMSQTMGAPCDPVVKKGDEVTVGMKIGDSDKFMSAPVHSPASGTITEIKDFRMANGNVCKAAVIETDGQQTVSADIKPPVVTDRKSFISAVRESGCCGLGGAAFPTHVKMSFDPEKTPIDTLVINGAECEPYITADYREFMENAEDVLEGIRLVMKYLEIPNCIIGIEGNKPLAIADMKKRIAEDKTVTVHTLPSLYPQGAEKVLIYSLTGRIVAEGELPSNMGVMVLNVSTVGFIARYIKTGMPLVSKRLTLDGDCVTKSKGNYRVLIGTHISEVAEYCGAEEAGQLLFGGPMMGYPVSMGDQTVQKGTNALLAFKKPREIITTSCIRCGRCIRACPVDLMPVQLESAYDTKNAAELMHLKINLCINCGCCTYVCPANRRLAEKNQLAKAFAAEETKKLKSAERK